MDVALQAFSLGILAGHEVPAGHAEFRAAPAQAVELLLEFGAQAGHPQHQPGLCGQPGEQPFLDRRQLLSVAQHDGQRAEEFTALAHREAAPEAVDGDHRRCSRPIMAEYRCGGGGRSEALIRRTNCVDRNCVDRSCVDRSCVGRSCVGRSCVDRNCVLTAIDRRGVRNRSGHRRPPCCQLQPAVHGQPDLRLRGAGPFGEYAGHPGGQFRGRVAARHGGREPGEHLVRRYPILVQRPGQQLPDGAPDRLEGERHDRRGQHRQPEAGRAAGAQCSAGTQHDQHVDADHEHGHRQRGEQAQPAVLPDPVRRHPGGRPGSRSRHRLSILRQWAFGQC